MVPKEIKEIIQLSRDELTVVEKEIDHKKKVSDSFLTNEKVKIKKTYINAVEQINLFQKSYFIYDRSNFMERTFINEIKFLPIYCSGNFYGETEKEKIDLITGKNAKSFFIEKSVKKELNLKIVKVSEKKTETTDNKIPRIARKRKTKMNTTYFINIRGQQMFLENSINLIEIKIENDTVKNMIEKYKKKPSKIYT